MRACLSRKEAGDLPFGQFPTLQVGDQVFAQSYSIAKYAARVANLMPSDPLEVSRRPSPGPCCSVASRSCLAGREIVPHHCVVVRVAGCGAGAMNTCSMFISMGGHIWRILWVVIVHVGQILTRGEQRKGASETLVRQLRHSQLWLGLASDGSVGSQIMACQVLA